MMELCVVSLVIAGAVMGVCAAWSTFNLQLWHIQDRIILLREAQVARTMLAADWLRGTNAALNPGEVLSLEFPGDSQSRFTQNGSVHYSHSAQYSVSGNQLVRQDNGQTSSPAPPWTMTAAQFVSQTDNSFALGPLFYSTLSFQKNGLTSNLNVLMVNCGLLQGQADCGTLFPLFFYSPFQPIESNVVYSSITAILGGLGG
jgi:hypothetical protein